ISPSHAFVLLSVYREPGIQPKAIGEELQLTPSTITRLLEKLETKGLVERQSVGRNTQVFPTEKCCGIHHEVEQAWIGLHARYSEMLGKESTQNLTEMLNAANRQLEDPSSGSP
ncbi:MAG: MarR family transcriptional regulator, partial [Bacteroidota bacterium]